MDVMKLRATLGLDKKDYEDGLRDAESEAGRSGGVLSGIFAGTAKAIGVGIGASAAAVGKLVKDSISAYAEFEQLTGGVNTLFKDSSDEVMKYASNAFKTAGMSANEYMTTVTSFSASLLQSLDGDTAKAAEKADLAITDMSDNANKMGTSMEAIQNAYQGFAKQNYTMLDNLKLGYGGTKEEMQRLLEDAEKLSGQKFDISSYADIVDAIHVVQTEMDITNTTAEEAEKTISGSLAMTKSAWMNLVTGITDPNADIGKLIDDLVYSATKALDNLMPAVSRALSGVSTLLSNVAPIIAKELPGIVNQILPQLISAGTDLFSGLANALPTLMGVIIDQLPTVLDSVIEVIVSLLPQLIELGYSLITTLLEGITEAIPVLTERVSTLITDLAAKLPEELPNIIETVLTLLQNLATTLAENAPILINAGIQLLMGLIQGFVNSFPILIEMIPVLIETLANVINDNMPTIIESGIQIILMLAKGLIEALPVILANMGNIIKAVIAVIRAINWLNIGKDLINFIANGIKSLFSSIPNLFKDIMNNGINAIRNIDWMGVGRNVINGILAGLKAAGNVIKDFLLNMMSNAVDAVKNFFGIHSPSKLMEDMFYYVPLGAAEGIKDGMPKFLDAMEDMEVTPIIDMSSGTSGSDSTKPVSSVTNNWNININKEVGTADDIGRALREEAQYGLIGGEALGT